MRHIFKVSLQLAAVLLITGVSKARAEVREKVVRVQMRYGKAEHLKSIPGAMSDGLGGGVLLGLFTLAAPLAALMIPITLGWGAVAVPVSAVWDLVDLAGVKQDVLVY
jgi:hypothetical protein